MRLNDTLIEPYRMFRNLIICISIAVMVFGFPLVAYELGQLIGPRAGETVFEFTHPNQMGKIAYNLNSQASQQD